ncbi:MAG: 30S ribosomal protein S6, partial [Caulobacterales bacterium]|nr:30S ribosomal protein S6 [Caulobacterales bacterium]
MPLYEHTLIARQDISPQQVDTLVEEITALVEEQGGKVVKNEYWGLRNLQYRIRKNRKGHYARLGVEAPAEAMTEVERRLKINEDVLRYLTIRVETIDAETPSPILAKREERRRRDG